MEVWKDIKGFEGYYQVSNKARVRSVDRIIDGVNQWGKITFSRKSIIRKGSISRSGRRRVNLYRDGTMKTIPIHRLVATAFVPNPKGYNIVNHKDGNPLNNLPDNLEWCTASHNTRHAYEMGLAKGRPGEQHHNAKLNEDQVNRIRVMHKSGKYTVSILSEKFNISQSQIHRIIHYKRWKNGKDRAKSTIN